MAKNQAAFIEEIVKALKSVPKARLCIARDIIGALAEPPARGKGRGPTRKAQKSLLDTPFCGMWQDRRNIGNGRSYARTLRQTLESRGESN